MVPRVDLPDSLEASLAAGHPWVYRDPVPRSFDAPTGSWVRIRAGRFTGYARWDAESPLALRVFSTKGVPDGDWIRERVRDAFDRRAPIRARGDTTCYRWLNGEGDGLPGIVADVYEDVVVIVTDGPALDGLLDDVVPALGDVAPACRVVRRHRAGPGDRLEILRGTEPPAELSVTESGLRFVVNLAHGQKTGLFLDQRENRRTVESLAAGCRVLNLFSYTGGFSLYAARGGASHVTSVDVSPGATEAARKSFAASGIDPDAHAFVARDAFEFLEERAGADERFDLVVCDPPSFARKQSQVAAAERAYVRVNAAALALVADGGILAAASCTSRVGPASFVRCLAEAGRRAGRGLRVVHEAGHALDHPILAGHPEGRYLHFVIARVFGRL